MHEQERREAILQLVNSTAGYGTASKLEFWTYGLSSIVRLVSSMMIGIDTSTKVQCKPTQRAPYAPDPHMAAESQTEPDPVLVSRPRGVECVRSTWTRSRKIRTGRMHCVTKECRHARCDLRRKIALSP
jgi:hypothetical protein